MIALCILGQDPAHYPSWNTFNLSPLLLLLFSGGNWRLEFDQYLGSYNLWVPNKQSLTNIIRQMFDSNAMYNKHKWLLMVCLYHTKALCIPRWISHKWPKVSDHHLGMTTCTATSGQWSSLSLVHLTPCHHRYSGHVMMFVHDLNNERKKINNPLTLSPIQTTLVQSPAMEGRVHCVKQVTKHNLLMQ